MRELVAAYERRYRRELHDIGVAHAIAAHDPQGLDKAFATPPAGQDGSYDRSKKWW